MTQVRAMQESDVDPLLLFCHWMHQESPTYRQEALDDGKLLALGKRILEDPERFCGLVAESEGRLQGMFAGLISESFYGTQKVASDVALFVPQNHRGGRTALRLLQEFERWARDRGAQVIRLGITTGVALERTGALYEHCGFVPLGMVYQKTLNGRV